ncbi:TPA: DUF551 domain-containing protein [Escherichia coli]|nr:DUF551 domain-containing protein [Escherichia coli]
MTTITKERLLTIRQWRETYGPGSNVVLPAEEAEELARIALVSLEAEPVAKIIAHYPLGVDVGKQKFVQAIRELPDFGGYLFAAPPAPIVPEEMYWQDAPVEGSSKAAAYATGWNACRATMLQSGNFRENKNSSTNNFREIAETSTNYPVIPSEVLSAILKVAKIRADFDDFDGDRRGIGDCLDEAEQELIVTINKYASQLAVVPVGLDERAAFNAWNNDENLPIAGVGAKNAAWLAWQARAELGRSLAVNSPVIPDSWISCSERMPNDTQWCVVNTEYGYYVQCWSEGQGWFGDDISIPECDVINWMPLPEPPQEVNQ